MKYLLAMIFTCLVITSVNASIKENNTCNFRSFCPGGPISPADLNYNFAEVKNCTNSGPPTPGGNCGCMVWEGQDVNPKTGDDGNSLHFLTGGDTLYNAESSANLVITNINDQPNSIRYIIIYKANGTTLATYDPSPDLAMAVNQTRTYSFKDLFTLAGITNSTQAAEAASLFIDVQNKSPHFNVHAVMCFKAGS